MAIRFEEDEAQNESGANKENIQEELGRGKRSVLLQEQTRNKQTNEDKRKEHQKKLAEDLNEKARRRLASSTQAVEPVKLVK